MTDSSNPRAPKSSRRKSKREPATIDLKATVVDDGIRPDEVAKDRRTEDTIAAGEPAAMEAVADSQVTLDSGAGTDSIAVGASAEEQVARERDAQDTLGQDTSGQDTSGRDSRADEIPVEDALAQEALVQEALAREFEARDEPVRTASPPPPPPPERRGSPAAVIGSGLLGGLVGAGIVYGLQMWQAPPVGDDQRLVRLEQRVGALGQPGAPGGNLQAVEERISALETARAPLDQRLQALQTASEQALARAEEAVNRPAPEASAAAPQNDAALNEITGRLTALEEQVRTGAQNAAAATQALDQRFAEQERRLGEQDQQRTASLDRRLGEQDQRSTALDRRLTEQDQRAMDRERRLTEQDQRAAERDRRLAEIDQRLAALSRQIEEGNKDAETASQAGIRVILAERLGDALRAGSPYAEVLEGLRKAGTEPDNLAPLEPFAQSGAPTAAALAQSFEPLAATILRDERAASGDWTDRLLRMADRVVTVRPVNEPGSTGVSSLIARIEQALGRGDAAAAAAAWEALPEPARRLSEEWGRQVKALAQASQASQAVGANALGALNRTTQ